MASRAPRVYQRGPTWYADIRDGEHRSRVSLGRCENKTQARLKALALEADTRADKPAHNTPHTLHAALLAWMRADERSDTDLSILKIVQEKYKDRPISEVTDDSLKQALPSLTASNWNRYRSTLRAALNLYAASHKTPVPRIDKKKLSKGLPRFLTQGEWARLHKELPKHLKGPAELAMSTGLRQGNVFGLRWIQVSFANKTVTVPANQAKAGEVLHLPLSDSALATLRRQQGRHDTYVFVYGGRRMYSPKTGFASAKTRAKVKDFTWHDFRHTWASWHVLAGTPLKVLQELGGWASLDMVMAYAYLLPSHLAQYAGNIRATPSPDDLPK